MKGFGEIKKLSKSIEKGKSNKQETINIAIKLHAQGNISEASKLYKHLIDKGFANSNVFANYALIVKSFGKLEYAEQLTRKAIQLKPHFPEAYSNIAVIFKELGKLEDAEKFLMKAILQKPKFVSAYYNLGLIQKQLGKLEQAKKFFIKTIELDPNFSEAYSNLGNVLRDLGRLEEAEEYIFRAIALKPNFSEAYSNLGSLFCEQGRIKDAEKFLLKAIELNPNFSEAYSNLGNVYRDFGKLQDAEKFLLKAIELDPNFSEAYSNLGNVLRDLGKLDEAKQYMLKAINLNPELTKAYFSLSVFNLSSSNKEWKIKLFSEKLLLNKTLREKIDVYFARSNIFYQEKKYDESAHYLKLANDLKLTIKSSNLISIFNKSKILLTVSHEKYKKQNFKRTFPQSIFIVGMPRSGSTLIESILSMNKNVSDLGETMILEEAFNISEENKSKFNLTEIYHQKLETLMTDYQITTNKNLYNFLYTGIISQRILNAKVIYCLRNPLDNILSIYKANFAKGSEFSSSIIDCAKLYIHQYELMRQYKYKFDSKIFYLNYDLLVANPIKEIKLLINWLGWDWHDSYTFPHKSKRSIQTASNISVRSPINSKSVGGWKKYRSLLQPAENILNEYEINL